jgi:hypothetical protein
MIGTNSWRGSTWPATYMTSANAFSFGKWGITARTNLLTLRSPVLIKWIALRRQPLSPSWVTPFRLASSNAVPGAARRWLPRITDGIVSYIHVTCIQVTRYMASPYIETAKTRLKRVLEAEREEKRNAKKAVRRR